MEKMLLALLREEPELSEKELAKRLELSASEERQLKKPLRHVREFLKADRAKVARKSKKAEKPERVSASKAGKTAKTEKSRPGDSQNTLDGKIEITRRGFGYLISETEAGDLFIPPRRLKSAMNGDRVRVRAHAKDKKTRKGWGEVIEILQRATKTLPGMIRSNHGGPLFFVPFDKTLQNRTFVIDGGTKKLKEGDAILADIQSYPENPLKPLRLKVQTILGREGEVDRDTALVAARYGLPRAFSDEVEAAAAKLPENPGPEDWKGRMDFRKKRIFTMDGADARDFDDALHIEKNAKGNYLLGVHIADVSHYVQPGTVLDKEALARGTSAYFPGHVVPMFPENLSNGLCSLNPYVPRLTQSCVMEFTPEGERVDAQFFDSVIQSSARLVYEDVTEFLEGAEVDNKRVPPELYKDLRLLKELRKALNRQRSKRGSIDFDLPSAKLLLDDAGDTVGVVPENIGVANHIVEECMLAANEAVAEFLFMKKRPTVYRVHEAPNAEKTHALKDFLDGFNIRVALKKGEPLTPLDLQNVIRKTKGRPEERIVSHVVLRTMMRAVYSVENQGHFGLAAPVYTHFTSPIRRYPDLIVHRALRDERQNKKIHNLKAHKESLVHTAKALSDLERRAQKAEWDLLDLKKARFMMDKTDQIFEGFITGVTAHGVFVQLTEFFVEGFIPREAMKEDHYHFDRVHHRLKGMRKGRIYRLCDPVTVRVIGVNLDRREIEFKFEDK